MDIAILLNLQDIISDSDVIEKSLSIKNLGLELLGKSLIKSFIVNSYVDGDWNSNFRQILRKAAISPRDESQLLMSSLLKNGFCRFLLISDVDCLAAFRQLIGSIYQDMEFQWQRYQILDSWFRETLLEPISK